MRKLRLIASSAVFLWVLALAGCTVGRGSSADNTPKPSVVVIGESTDVERSAASSSSASPADTYEDTGPRAASAATATTALDAIAANITATLLPAIQSQVATAEARVPSASLPADATEALVLTHTVAGGDTLIRIADHYGVSLSSLLAVNDLPNPDHLEVGQVINLPQTPVDYTLSFHILPDSRLVRSIGARDFDIEGFIASQDGILRRMAVTVPKRSAAGNITDVRYSASEVVERVSLEYSVDARIMLAFLDHFAQLLSQADVESELQLYPLLSNEENSWIDRTGLYSQLSWLADTLNRGYYDWKYRGIRILEFADGNRQSYAPDLNAGTIAVQFALANLLPLTEWDDYAGESGLYQTYRRLFGDPFTDEHETVPADLVQPPLDLPFPRGEVWRFTGGFHGGWGNGGAWAAVDFSPPEEEGQAAFCYVSAFPATAVSSGTIVRLGEGFVVLDLDGDGNEGSGWSILYLHIDHHEALKEGHIVEAGNILGYPSCSGGVTTATHLHIARRYNGEWIPADCNRCAADVSIPSFVMSDWQVVGLGSQLYQGFLIHQLDNRSAVAEQGRYTDINAISW